MKKNFEKYFNLINSINCDLTIKENLIEFIKSYDGSNEDALDNLILSAISIMTAYSDAKIKAEGYDKIVEIHKDFKQELADLKYEYNKLNEGKLLDDTIDVGGFVEDDKSPTNK